MNAIDVYQVERDAVEISVLEVSQPLGTFFVGVIEAKDLQRIAAADTRRKVDREIELYTGIQRELSKKRQVEISSYISTFDASFPNSFIIAIHSKDILYQSETLLRIRANDKVASIIDGQHRLAGFNKLNSNGFKLIVSIFIDLPMEDQAMLFATINLKQTKVNPSLVFDLFEETKLRSPEKTCHNIVKALNGDVESPFYHRIKPLGKRTEEYKGSLTQATFVKQLLPLISVNPEMIRDVIKRGGTIFVDDPDNANCIFWKFFATDKDWAILKIVNNYFYAVRETFNSDWKSEESPLPRTIGFCALMSVFEKLYRKGEAQGTLEVAFFKNHLVKARHLAPFSFEEYPPSGGGQLRLEQILNAVICEEGI